MKSFFLLAFICFCNSLFSQDTVTPVATLQKIKTGLYSNCKAFIDNTPSTNKPSFQTEIQ